MVELVDTTDSKSVEGETSCGFESHLRYKGECFTPHFGVSTHQIWNVCSQQVFITLLSTVERRDVIEGTGNGLGYKYYFSNILAGLNILVGFVGFGKREKPVYMGGDPAINNS